MVQFLRRHILAEFEPQAVQKVDFLRGEMRSMRPKVEDVFLPIWRMDLQRQLRLRLGERFPRQACYARLLSNRSSRRKPQNDGGRLQALGRAKNTVPFFRRRSNSEMHGLAALFRQIQR